MKFAVLAFPGSNCEMDLYNAIKDIIKEDVELVSYKNESLDGFDAVLIPGGFSYGDYLRSGAIARFSPIIPALQEFANSGKPVLGICNGFQILTEAGLLPGSLQKMFLQSLFVRLNRLLSITTNQCSVRNTRRVS